MSSSSTRTDNPSETQQGVSQISKQQQQRAVIPQIEVVNEIQIIINKKDQRSLNVTTPSDSKDIKKCISSRSSKTDLTAVTTDTTKTVTIKTGRRTSRDKDKSDSSSICVCGKLLKRVKGLLEKKDKASAGEWNANDLLKCLNESFDRLNENINESFSEAKSLKSAFAYQKLLKALN